MEWFVIKLLFRKEEIHMAALYALRIMRGKMTLNDVPVKIREQVKEILIDAECEYLI